MPLLFKSVDIEELVHITGQMELQAKVICFARRKREEKEQKQRLDLRLSNLGLVKWAKIEWNIHLSQGMLGGDLTLRRFFLRFWAAGEFAILCITDLGASWEVVELRKNIKYSMYLCVIFLKGNIYISIYRNLETNLLKLAKAWGIHNACIWQLEDSTVIDSNKWFTSKRTRQFCPFFHPMSMVISEECTYITRMLIIGGDHELAARSTQVP